MTEPWVERRKPIELEPGYDDFELEMDARDD